MTTDVLELCVAPDRTTAPAGAEHRGRMRFAFLAETSRCLSDSLDLETTLATVANIALPQFGVWCMVDIVASDESISRVAVIHPDAAKQKLARNFFHEHPPHRDDPIGAPRVIRTNHSEFALVEGPALLDQIEDAKQRDLLRQLGAQSFLIVAMRARGRTLGAITFVSDDTRTYDDADLLLAEDLGRRCAMAIDNARTYGLAQEARRGAEAAREAATFAAQRANALREIADSAREQAETANRTKAAFLTTMSHEFRTPLGAILGFVGLMNDGLAGPLTPLQRDYVRRIGNASGNLLRLIEEVLTLSQVHAGRGTMHVEHIDLAASVREVADLLQPLVETKKLSLVVDVPEVPLLFPTDEAKFRQIVINLTGNAVKFTAMGEVRLSLEAEEAGVVLRVRDTGEGISVEDAERLFESFMQAGASGSRQSQGTGLGLAISRQLAQLMGGDVTVESVPGCGSTFTLRLPYSAEATAEGEAAQARTAFRERRARARIERT
ncbi:MAG TPA: GAF domain-containing sensor histidine kinase [Gemmatimonadaceae bacterium]|jgi:signal transduction histidine kinase